MRKKMLKWRRSGNCSVVWKHCFDFFFIFVNCSGMVQHLNSPKCSTDDQNTLKTFFFPSVDFSSEIAVLMMSCTAVCRLPG